MTSTSGERTEPLRVPGVARLQEGRARKIYVPDPVGGPPREVVFCRVGGELFALDSLCPHEGGRIADGPLMEGRYAFCPLHLYKFDPRDGRAVEIECDSATTYPAREIDGVAEIQLDGADGDAS